ncbi:hypothetical protein TDB9533_01616 [Thalassocella blandensis]|nr:hypothetical protein TDB9533_01616 [Thalassocella blandensis]
MNNLADSKHTKPWYREPYAWLVAGPLILVVIACCFTVTIAFRSADDRVSDDYYKEGRMLAQEFTSDDYAKSIGVHASIHFYPARSSIIAEIGADETATLEEVVELKLLISHPAEQAKDINLVLTPSALDKFRVELPQELSGRWYLRLQGMNVDSKELWRLHGEINLNQTQTAELVPK